MMMLRMIHRAAVAFGALLLASGLVAIAAGFAGATEAGRITVQRTAVVTGPTIKLGDLARLEGSAEALADVDFGPSPSASAPRRLEGEAILRRLQAAGMDASATRYVIPASVRVERTAQEVSVEEIRTAVLNVASDALPAGETIRDLEVAGPVRIPAGPYEARVSTTAQGRPGRRRFEVQLVNEGTVLANVPVTARTEARGPVVVTKQSIPRGVVLTSNDVAVVQRNQHDVPDDALTAPEQAIGMETKVALAAAAPLPRAALAAPVVVKKGDLVTMLIETQVMRLSVAGEALEAGAIGGGIKVMNRASKQTVAGKVIEHGVVLVER
ncbi:MAG: flagella basal body P-ring formation protein FlgA [Deltaproteobacteria bacterium]|nr:flagella basal body P-ring formation protein FlgA [Deltaproteobacteria bacterium]